MVSLLSSSFKPSRKEQYAFCVHHDLKRRLRWAACQAVTSGVPREARLHKVHSPRHPTLCVQQLVLHKTLLSASDGFTITREPFKQIPKQLPNSRTPLVGPLIRRTPIRHPSFRKPPQMRCVVATGMATEIGAIQGAVTEAAEKAARVEILSALPYGGFRNWVPYWGPCL